jgi:transcriptional regulator with XRE-family HTH domain
MGTLGVMLNTESIRVRRELLGRSQDEVAHLAGIKGGRQKWNDIEKGRNVNPTLETLLGMARALQCSIADLVDEDYPPKGRRPRRQQTTT